MRCAVVCLGLVLTSCNQSPAPAVQPEAPQESTRAEASVSTPATVQPTAKPVLISFGSTIAPTPPPPSPFLVPTTPPQPTAASSTATPPPVVVPPATLPTPPPPPPTWSTTTNKTGKPCPIGRCLLDGKCVKPGGPVADERDPPDVVSGVCGGDGGPCSRCRCVATGTFISTPRGEVPIEDLKANDLVWSIDHGRVAVVRILATQRLRVTNHSVAQIRLADGFVFEVSGEHPLGDGRLLWDLHPGESLQNQQIESLTLVPYDGAFTHDILPDSDTGTYFVHGVWLGSTMFGQTVRGDVVVP